MALRLSGRVPKIHLVDRFGVTTFSKEACDVTFVVEHTVASYMLSVRTQESRVLVKIHSPEHRRPPVGHPLPFLGLSGPLKL